jgi:hypothetical protein
MIEIKSDHVHSTSTRKKTKNKIQFSFDSLIFSEKIIYGFSPDDTSNVFFDHVQMRIEGDILYRLDESGSKTDAHYVLVKSL